MTLIASIFACVVRGHRWDVAPGFGRGRELECVRCGLRADPNSGLAA